MPLTLDTPQASPHGDLDTYKINAIVIDAKSKCIRIQYDLGKMEEGEFVAYYQKSHDVRDIPEQVNPVTQEVVAEAVTDFTDEVIQEISPGISRYAYHKSWAYDILSEAGLVGSGTIS